MWVYTQQNELINLETGTSLRIVDEENFCELTLFGAAGRWWKSLARFNNRDDANTALKSLAREAKASFVEDWELFI